MAASHKDSLVGRCAAGDELAWRTIVDRFAGYVQAIGRAHRLPDDVIDDVVQNTFAALARRIDSLVDDAVLPSWLQATATRECWRRSRRLRRDRSGGAEEAVERLNVSHDDLERAEEHARLRIALGELGERCRDLLQALYLDAGEPSYEVIAMRLGIPIGSIGPQRRRCLDRLLQRLQADGSEPEEWA